MVASGHVGQISFLASGIEKHTSPNLLYVFFLMNLSSRVLVQWLVCLNGER